MSQAKKTLGMVGWRGMVGSFLMDRMRQEGDFERVETLFFTTSNAGGQAPQLGVSAGVLLDAHDLTSLMQCDIIITTQGGEYTQEIHPKLRSKGWSGHWIDAASTLRMTPDAVIILDPVNRHVIDSALDSGKRNWIGGNCTVSLMLMAMGGLFKAGMVDFIQRLHVHTSIGERLQQHRSVSEEYLNALHTSHLETLLTYIQGPPIFSAGSYFGFNALSFLTPPTIFIITIGSILLTRYRGDPSRQREVLALLALATGGLVSSMSWFLFAHGHSYIHTHINYILWHVPYAFLAAPICIRLAQISRGIKLA